MPSAEDIRAEVHFAGHVQGVGFRFTAQSVARSYDVTGYVQNLPDGRVKLVAEGPKTEVNGLLAEIARRMEGHIHHQDRRDVPPRGEFARFEVRH